MSDFERELTALLERYFILERPAKIARYLVECLEPCNLILKQGTPELPGTQALEYKRGYDAATADKGWTKLNSAKYIEGWFKAIEDRINTGTQALTFDDGYRDGICGYAEIDSASAEYRRGYAQGKADRGE